MNALTKKPKLIFVYNADGGVFNLLSDVAHKILSPETYSCNLCSITHTNFGMKKEWKQYLESLGNLLEFLHADEFRTEYKREKVGRPLPISVKIGLAVGAGALLALGFRALIAKRGD